MAYQQIDPKDLGPHLAKRSEELHHIVHAHWIVEDCIQDYVSLVCSACSLKWQNKRYRQYPNYCPNCGAKMNNSIKINYHVNFKNCGTKMGDETKDE